MGPAVTAEFVALSHDPANQVRIALGHPPEAKERSGHVVIAEELEDPIGVPLDASFKIVPLVPMDNVRESLHLEIVFHIDGHGIDQFTGLSPRSAVDPQETGSLGRIEGGLRTGVQDFLLVPRPTSEM
jgi:hypothetical protein